MEVKPMSDLAIQFLISLRREADAKISAHRIHHSADKKGLEAAKARRNGIQDCINVLVSLRVPGSETVTVAAPSDSCPSKENKLRIGPQTLNAKWLDPACWDGCQSLVFKAQGERVSKDTARLDWLEEHQDVDFVVSHPVDHDDRGWVLFHDQASKEVQGKTLRAAIDAAMGDSGSGNSAGLTSSDNVSKEKSEPLSKESEQKGGLPSGTTQTLREKVTLIGQAARIARFREALARITFGYTREHMDAHDMSAIAQDALDETAQSAPLVSSGEPKRGESELSAKPESVPSPRGQSHQESGKTLCEATSVIVHGGSWGGGSGCQIGPDARIELWNKGNEMLASFAVSELLAKSKTPTSSGDSPSTDKEEDSANAADMLTREQQPEETGHAP